MQMTFRYRYQYLLNGQPYIQGVSENTDTFLLIIEGNYGIYMHMFNTRDERRVFGNLFDSIFAIIRHVVLLHEGKC